MASPVIMTLNLSNKRVCIEILSYFYLFSFVAFEFVQKCLIQKLECVHEPDTQN